MTNWIAAIASAAFLTLLASTSTCPDHRGSWIGGVLMMAEIVYRRSPCGAGAAFGWLFCLSVMVYYTSEHRLSTTKGIQE